LLLRALVQDDVVSANAAKAKVASPGQREACDMLRTYLHTAFHILHISVQSCCPAASDAPACAPVIV
jgi:hypothetical protein